MNTVDVKGWGGILNIMRNGIRYKAIDSTLEQITAIMRRDICHFQLHYTNYQFGVSQKHKALKDAFTKKVDCTERLESFINFVENGMSVLFGDIAGNTRNYFDTTRHHDTPPRVTIYLVDENNRLVDLVMIPKPSESVPDDKLCIDNFTSLTTVLGEGIPYLVNSIPAEIMDDDSYFHPEFDVDRIRRSYTKLFSDRKPISILRNNYLKPFIDRNWNQMKIGNDITINLHKSHLVVPITYRAHLDKNSLNKEMVRLLKLDGNGRSILGFICVDHMSTYYFNDHSVQSYKNIDINILYVYADLLSLIIVTYLTYTVGSSTYTECMQTKGEIK